MQNITAEYHALLTAEESLTALDGAIALARRIAPGAGRARGGRWLDIINGNGGPGASSSGHTERPNSRRVYEVTSILSALPAEAARHDVPEEQYSLLMDTLLLVFHHAYFALLPKAKGDRDSLLKAFRAFGDSLPRLADRFQVAGLVEIELGRTDAACEAFGASLAATPSQEHDFLTRLQMVWSTLMDGGLVSEAFKCLQEVAPRVTRIDFDEFQGLVAATFAEAQRR